MKLREGHLLGEKISPLVDAGQIDSAFALLAPVLAQRIHFPVLGAIGEVIGQGPLEKVNPFLERIAQEATEGGWVVIGLALNQQLKRDLVGAFVRCRKFIIQAGVWHGTDNLGERVPGPALLSDFEAAIPELQIWRTDENYWVRRAVGVAVHFWAKRTKGAVKYQPRARMLLDLLAPMFREREISAVKGVGWGLKTLGRYYPALTTEWLVRQVAKGPGRALMLRKALTYLPEAGVKRVREAIK